MDKLEISSHGNIESAKKFTNSLEKSQFTFCLVISYTETSEIPGITIAGADKEFLKFTSPADAEFLRHGFCKCIDSIPMSPDGKPTPALLTKASLDIAKIPHFVINAGSKIHPDVSYFDSQLDYGKNISESTALTPEKVPTPPAAAHAPEEAPVVIETPLPPSIRGKTSAPDILNEFKFGNNLLIPQKNYCSYLLLFVFCLGGLSSSN